MDSVHYPPATNELDLSSVLIVTALSGNHFKEMLKFCDSFVNNTELASHPNLRLVIYNLGGLHEDQIRSINKTCDGAEFRDFQFDRYPSYMKNLFQYGWKPMILNETLAESDVVIWSDASTELRNSNETFENFIQEIARSNITMRLIGSASHSIFRATHETMYSYLPIPLEKAKALTMYEDGKQVWVKTPTIVEAVLNPWVNCAMQKNCMAPPGSERHCNLKRYPEPLYAFCHRYDQSAINILLANAANFDGKLYQSDSPLMRTKRM
ncbi:hypothetical protein L596_010392 [Steinernema carpocapsae]|uniref:Nucleotide-diphospho-sugar transferase domain-containing protein n=1 Tax=Steinernema carpocapsae TaxID=34508 RepID=A0A4U5PIX6_STECR|nr:hypothetical protein L596_010392 [Steinernema carpocapsae]